MFSSEEPPGEYSMEAQKNWLQKKNDKETECCEHSGRANAPQI